MMTSRTRFRAIHAARSRRAGVVIALLACLGLAACTAAETPPPASTAEASVVAPLPESGSLDAGTYLVTGFTVPFEITVPDGWESGGWILLNEEAGDWGAYVVILPVEFFVPTDGCASRDAESIEVDRSLEGFVDALAAQVSSETTAPVEVTVGDFSGLEFDISVEDGVEPTECDEAAICLFSDRVNACAQALQQPRQHQTVRVLDLNGELVFLAGGDSFPDDPALGAEARAVFDSIVFAPGQ